MELFLYGVEKPISIDQSHAVYPLKRSDPDTRKKLGDGIQPLNGMVINEEESKQCDVDSDKKIATVNRSATAPT